MKKPFLFVFIFLIVSLFLSIGMNFYFLQTPSSTSEWKGKLKIILHRTEKEKSIKANPEVYSFFITKKFKTKTAEIDFIRNWIFENSFGTGNVNYKSSFDPKISLKDIYLASLKKAEKPAMSCGPRAFAMDELLSMLGFETRFVSIYFSSFSNKIGSHSYLEVLNPDTKKWEIHDPLNDVYYIDTLGQRLNTLQISQMKPGEFKPCRNSQDCGGEVMTDDFTKMSESFKLVSIKPKGKDVVSLLNSKYYDPLKYYPEDSTTFEGSFCNDKNLIVY